MIIRQALTLFLLFAGVSFAQAQTAQQGTAFPETGSNFVFLLAANNDLYGIKKFGTDSKTTEIHVLSSADGYKSFKLHTATGLHETNDDYEFLLASNNDLVVIKKRGAGGKTEVHILSAASSYQKFSLQTATALSETDKNFRFLMDADRNLFAIKKQGVSSTEVHVLSAADNYGKFILQTKTGLHKTDDSFEFLLDSDRNLVAIKKNAADTGKTEVHILSRGSNYLYFLLQTETALHATGKNFQFLISARDNIFAIKTGDTGTRSTEIHVLSVASEYKNFSVTAAANN